mmetsp:Transcript_24949/g.74878  ORF Transcript_24949/g.74878 Transcript_24949/m.74878 type:complete len:86 (-) Transcript_24949:329-586(-)
MPTKPKAAPAAEPADPPKKRLKPLPEKEAAFQELTLALEDQEAEICAKLERVEEKIIQNHERNSRDSNPIPSVFMDLAQKAVWSG